MYLFDLFATTQYATIFGAVVAVVPATGDCGDSTEPAPGSQGGMVAVALACTERATQSTAA